MASINQTMEALFVAKLAISVTLSAYCERKAEAKLLYATIEAVLPHCDNAIDNCDGTLLVTSALDNLSYALDEYDETGDEMEFIDTVSICVDGEWAYPADGGR